MPAPKLLLHPADPGTAAVPDDRLAQELQAVGLIAERKLLKNTVFYPVGEHFLQLVTFLGCSPAIELDPPDDPQELERASAAGRFCHIFIDSGEQLRFRGDSQTRAPGHHAAPAATARNRSGKPGCSRGRREITKLTGSAGIAGTAAM